MANPLFNQYGNNIVNNPMAQFMSQFNQFRQNFRGDPRQQVQKLLNSGQMSQDQFNQLSQQANQIAAMMQNLH